MSNYQANVTTKVNFGELDKLESTLEKVKKTSITFDVRGSGLSELTSQLKQVQSIAKSMGAIKIGTSGANATSSWSKTQIASLEELAKVQEKVASSANKLQSTKLAVNINSLGAKGANVSSLKEQLTTIQSLEKELEKLNSLQNSGKLDSTGQNRMVAAQAELQAALKKTGNEYQVLKTQQSQFVSSTTAMTASNKMQSWLKNNSKAAKEYGVQITALAEQMKTVDNVGAFNKIQSQFKSFTSSAQAAGLTGTSWADNMKRGFGAISQFVGVYGVLQRGMQVAGQMATEVINVDTAMTQLKMATGATNTEAIALMKTYTQMGKELKATGVDVATSATEWLKQGQSQENSETLAKDSIILSKIGDLSSEDSTKYLTSAMKGYKIAAEDTLGVVDKLSAVDLASATDVGGLAEGMSEVANNANLAGVSIDKLLAYLATVGEVTQEGMSSVGHSFSTIFSRMGNIKLARLKDYQNNGEDLSNVETVLRGEGIKLRDSTDSFRNFGEVIDEVAGKWDGYSEVSQRAIASAFAGKNQMEEFLVLMENYDKVTEYQGLSENSSGQATQKFEAYQDSLKGKIEGFKNQFQELSTSLINSDLFGVAVEGGTEFLNIITSLTGALGGLGTVAAGVGIYELIKNFG